MRIKIGSRASDLARIQAYTVGKHLEQNGHTLEYIFRESLGDLNPDIDLSKTFEKGVFTQDFHQGLLDGTYDVVVHSWKDLPTEDRPGTEVVSTLPREDMRDVLLIRKQALKDPAKIKNLKIFSSSPRRAHNLKDFLSWALPVQTENVEFVNVRGNVPTRLQKLKESAEVHGLVVAKAALDRMLGSELEELKSTQIQMCETLNEFFWMVLPLKINPCAAAQGALALEISSSREDLRQAIVQLNCEESWRTVREERDVLKSFGGGCHQKIGVSVMQRTYGKVTILKGLADSGEILDRVELTDTERESKVKNHKQVFPLPGEDFPRPQCQRVPVEADILTSKDLWIARSEALPDGVLPDPHRQLVWTAGLKSWKALAKRGVWVNGCSESLGEQENEAIEILAGRVPNWIKLSHEQGVEFKAKAFLGTYRLVGEPEIPDLEQKKYFYWASGSQFLRAWKSHPEVLKAARHACGPGHTYSILSSVLKDRISVYLSVEQWWKDLGVLNEE